MRDWTISNSNPIDDIRRAVKLTREQNHPLLIRARHLLGAKREIELIMRLDGRGLNLSETEMMNYQNRWEILDHEYNQTMDEYKKQKEGL